MKAIKNNVIIKKEIRPETKNGFYLGRDTEYTRDIESGTIVSIGISCKEDFKIGDRVGYLNKTINKNNKQYNANEFTDDIGTLVVVGEHDVVFVYE